jgi:hypothetical protein
VDFSEQAGAIFFTALTCNLVMEMRNVFFRGRERIFKYYFEEFHASKDMHICGARAVDHPPFNISLCSRFQ